MVFARENKNLSCMRQDCSLAQAIWSKCNYSMVLSHSLCSKGDWWEHCFGNFGEDMVSVITMCWAMWGARNK